MTNEPIPPELKPDDPRLEVIVRKMGSTTAKLLGASHARAEFLFFLDDDTTVASDAIGNALEFLVNHPEVGLIQTKLLLIDGHTFDTAGGELDHYGFYSERGAGEPDRGQYERVERVFWASGSACIVRTEAFRRAGGYDPQDWAAIDIDLGWRVNLLGYKVAYLPSVKVYHHKSKTVSRLILRGISLGYSGSEVDAIRRKEVGWYNMCVGQLTMLIKNLSAWNTVRRIPVAMGVWVLSSSYFFAKGDISGGLRLSVAVRAVIFGALNFRRIYRRRRVTQCYVRKVKDSIVENSMAPSLGAMLRSRRRRSA